MLDHLPDLELVVPCSRLQEEVVRQIFDEIARGEDVVPIPRTTLRVLRQGALATGEEVMRIADPLEGGKRRLRCAPVVGRRVRR